MHVVIPGIVIQHASRRRWSSSASHWRSPLAEPFKNLLNPALVRAAAQHLAHVWSAFDASRFIVLANNRLEALEMKARAMHICDALEATLPGTFTDAADIIEAALAPPYTADQMNGLTTRDAGLNGWILWPVAEFVARRGQAEPKRALQSLHAITQRFTAEFAIRPFILQHPSLVFATLARWVHDPSPHVRRLVSEGSRPRLPWGLQLKPLIEDPSPALPLLEALQDDPSEYVRRSVANHLNDIAKDHPALVAAWVETHLVNATAERRALLRHASRTLIKKGDARVLTAWGLGKRFNGTAALKVAPGRVALGGHVTLTLVLRSTSKQAQKLVIDYAVHHVKANGTTSPKVFKGWVLELAPGATVELIKRHSMKPVTTRRYHRGAHAIDVNINGQTVNSGRFALTLV